MRVNLMTLKEYRKQLLNFVNFSSWLRPVAVTLTLKQMFHSVAGSVRLNADHAARNLRHFLNKLNRRYFKNAFDRHGKRLAVVPIMEVSHEGRLHYHLIGHRIFLLFNLEQTFEASGNQRIGATKRFILTIIPMRDGFIT